MLDRRTVGVRIVYDKVAKQRNAFNGRDGLGGDQPRGFQPRQAPERTLRPLLQSDRVVRDHAFRASQTGVVRHVDYFANSNANVALDPLQLALKTADDIVRRADADAEAFKIEDILKTNEVDIVVFCTVSADDAVHEVTVSAERVLDSVGASVVRTVEDAAGAMLKAVGTCD